MCRNITAAVAAAY